MVIFIFCGVLHVISFFSVNAIMEHFITLLFYYLLDCTYLQFTGNFY